MYIYIYIEIAEEKKKEEERKRDEFKWVREEIELSEDRG